MNGYAATTNNAICSFDSCGVAALPPIEVCGLIAPNCVDLPTGPECGVCSRQCGGTSPADPFAARGT